MLAFFVWSSFEARKKASNRVIDWLPQGTKELEVFLNRYQQHFVEGEYIMVSWKGGYIDDERLDIVAEILTAPLDDGSPPYFARTMTTWSVIEEHVKGILDQGMKQPGYVFNLGHGVFPEVNPDTLKRLTTFIHEYSKGQLAK